MHFQQQRTYADMTPMPHQRQIPYDMARTVLTLTFAVIVLPTCRPMSPAMKTIMGIWRIFRRRHADFISCRTNPSLHMFGSSSIYIYLICLIASCFGKAHRPSNFLVKVDYLEFRVYVHIHCNNT